MTTLTLFITLFTISLILNCVLAVKPKRSKRPDGLLNVDLRDPSKDYYDFVFLIPTGDIPKKRYLTVEVHTKGENSQGENF